MKIWFSVSVYSVEKDRFVAVFDNITERKLAEETMAESNRQLKALVTSLDNIVFEVDEQGIYRNIWTGNESLLAQPKDKLIGQRIRDALPEAVAARLEESIRRALNKNKVEEVEYPLDLPRGRHWFLARVSPIYSPDGFSKSVSILVRDITEPKQAEEALKQVEYKYRNIFENATESITQTTPDGKYLTANPATARMLGYEFAEELIASVSDLDHQFYVKPRRREEFLGLLEESGVVEGFESEVYRKDGKKIWISESSRAVKAENGTTLYYEGSGTDITERKQAEQALHESEQRFRTFIEQSVDGAVLIDEQGKIIEWNPAQEKITAIPKKEAMGSSFAEIQYQLLPLSRRAQTSIKYFKDVMQNAFHSGESPEFVKPVAVEIQTPTGDQKFLMQTAFPIKTNADSASAPLFVTLQRAYKRKKSSASDWQSWNWSTRTVWSLVNSSSRRRSPKKS